MADSIYREADLCNNLVYLNFTEADQSKNLADQGLTEKYAAIHRETDLIASCQCFCKMFTKYL